MREILFRGKDYKGNWLYGSLVKKTFLQPNWENLSEPNDIKNYSIVHKPEFAWDNKYDTTEVIENTIGQYTGLTDKNGKKIFEGDIVELVDIYANYSWTAIVEFGNPNGEYVWGWNLKPTPSCCISRLDEFNKDILCWVEIPVGAICKIIGNIYDNPELVKRRCRRMTTAELHKILDDEYKKISLEEYQNVLYQLKNDTIASATQEEFESQKQTPKYHWYYGETNAFEIALHLSEHINPNQTAIECLKEVKEKILPRPEYRYETLKRIEVINIIDNKIKELEEEK